MTLSSMTLSSPPLPSCRYSGRTLDAYRHDLRSGFFQWAADTKLVVLAATRPHIELYRSWMGQRALAAGTIDHRLSIWCAVSTGSLTSTGGSGPNPAHYVRRPQVHPSTSAAWTAPSSASRTARTIDLAVGEKCEGPILRRRDGQRLDRRTVHPWVRSIGKRAGLGAVHRACFALRSSWPRSTLVFRYARCRSPPVTPTLARPRSMSGAARTSAVTPPTWSSRSSSAGEPALPGKLFRSTVIGCGSPAPRSPTSSLTDSPTKPSGATTSTRSSPAAASAADPGLAPRPRRSNPYASIPTSKNESPAAHKTKAYRSQR